MITWLELMKYKCERGIKYLQVMTAFTTALCNKALSLVHYHGAYPTLIATAPDARRTWAKVKCYCAWRTAHLTYCIIIWSLEFSLRMTADSRSLCIRQSDWLTGNDLLDCLKYTREARALIAVCRRRFPLMSGPTCSYGIWSKHAALRWIKEACPVRFQMCILFS